MSKADPAMHGAFKKRANLCSGRESGAELAARWLDQGGCAAAPLVLLCWSPELAQNPPPCQPKRPSASHSLESAGLGWCGRGCDVLVVAAAVRSGSAQADGDKHLLALSQESEVTWRVWGVLAAGRACSHASAARLTVTNTSGEPPCLRFQKPTAKAAAGLVACGVWPQTAGE